MIINGEIILKQFLLIYPIITLTQTNMKVNDLFRNIFWEEFDEPR